MSTQPPLPLQQQDTASNNPTTTMKDGIYPFVVFGRFKFVAEEEDEVGFGPGEPVLVYERDELYGDSWWRGKNSKHEEGLFPCSFVTNQNTSNINSNDIAKLFALPPGKLRIAPLDYLHPSPNRSLPPSIAVVDPSTSAVTSTATPSSPPTSADNIQIQPTIHASAAVDQSLLPHPPPSPSPEKGRRSPIRSRSTTPDEFSYLTRAVDSWSIGEVARWVESQGHPDAVHKFIEHEISGDVLLDLNLGSLRELGVESLSERINILHAILRLKESDRQRAITEAKRLECLSEIRSSPELLNHETDTSVDLNSESLAVDSAHDISFVESKSKSTSPDSIQHHEARLEEDGKEEEEEESEEEGEQSDEENIQPTLTTTEAANSPEQTFFSASSQQEITEDGTTSTHVDQMDSGYCTPATFGRNNSPVEQKEKIGAELVRTMEKMSLGTIDTAVADAKTPEGWDLDDYLDCYFSASDELPEITPDITAVDDTLSDAATSLSSNNPFAQHQLQRELQPSPMFPPPASIEQASAFLTLPSLQSLPYDRLPEPEQSQTQPQSQQVQQKIEDDTAWRVVETKPVIAAPVPPPTPIENASASIAFPPPLSVPVAHFANVQQTRTPAPTPLPVTSQQQMQPQLSVMPGSMHVYAPPPMAAPVPIAPKDPSPIPREVSLLNMEGWLQVKPNSDRSYKKRWCVVRGSSMFIMKDANATTSIYSLQLDTGYQIHPLTAGSGTKTKFSFKITSPVTFDPLVREKRHPREFCFSAETQLLMMQWINVLCKAADGRKHGPMALIPIKNDKRNSAFVPFLGPNTNPGYRTVNLDK